MKLTCYTNVKFTKGHLIESLSDYLANRSRDYLNTEVVTSREFRSNVKKFKLRCEKAKSSSGTTYGDSAVGLINYIKLISEDNDTRYYFVNGYTFVNELVVDLDLELDVVNTYQSYIQKGTFKNVQMERRMKDRWVNYNSTYYRVYDKCDEGLGDVATQVEYNENVNNESSYVVTKTITDSDDVHIPFPIALSKLYGTEAKTVFGTQHYISTIHPLASSGHSLRIFGYCEDANDFLNCTFNPTTSTTFGFKMLTNAFFIHCEQYKEDGDWQEGYIFYLGNYSNGKFTAFYSYQTSSNPNQLYFKDNTATGPFKIQSQEITVTHEDSKTIGTTYNLSDLIDPANTWNSIAAIKQMEILPFSSVNRTDSTILNITDVPFFPDQTQCLNLANFGAVVKEVTSSTYKLDLNVSSSEPRHYTKNINKQVMTRSMINESKLYGSYVRNHQIVYDTFALPVQPEYYNGYIQSISTTIYKPIDMSNDLAFKCTSLVEQSLNSNVMSCCRNNSVVTWNSDYQNYVRNGYNYDEKAQSLNKLKTGINLGIGISSTILSFGMKDTMGALGVYNVTQSGFNTASTLANSIFSNIENDRALEQKRKQLMTTSPTMSGSGSVAMFKELNGGNVLKYVTTRPSDLVLESIYNLFYFTGYKDNTTVADLQLTKTREYFDYYQGNAAEFRTRLSGVLPQVFEWIKQELASGITIEHKYNNTWLCEGTLYENWETSI